MKDIYNLYTRSQVYSAKYSRGWYFPRMFLLTHGKYHHNQCYVQHEPTLNWMYVLTECGYFFKETKFFAFFTLNWGLKIILLNCSACLKWNSPKNLSTWTFSAVELSLQPLLSTTLFQIVWNVDYFYSAKMTKTSMQHNY